MRTQAAKFTVFLAVMFYLAQASASGPPLVTDDTGTADKGTLEILVFAAGESREAGESAQAPALDLAFGLSENMDIGLVIPRQWSKDAGEDSVNTWGEATVSVKWRFYEYRGRALAVAPAFSLPLTGQSTILGIIDDTQVFTIPLIASIARERWELTGNLGYSISSRTADAVSLSASIAYQIVPNLRLLIETWGVDFVGDGSSTGFINWNTGAEWALNRRLSILGAWGGGAWSQLDPEEQLENSYYLGFRYVVGE